MDEVLEVIGLNRTPEGDVTVTLFDEESGATVSFFGTEDETKSFKLGRPWRVRVTRSQGKSNE